MYGITGNLTGAEGFDQLVEEVFAALPMPTGNSTNNRANLQTQLDAVIAAKYSGDVARSAVAEAALDSRRLYNQTDLDAILGTTYTMVTTIAGATLPTSYPSIPTGIVDFEALKTEIKKVGFNSARDSGQNRTIIAQMETIVHAAGYSRDVTKSAVAEAFSELHYNVADIEGVLGKVNTAYTGVHTIQPFAGRFPTVNLANNTVQPGQQGNDFRIVGNAIKPALVQRSVADITDAEMTTFANWMLEHGGDDVKGMDRAIIFTQLFNMRYTFDNIRYAYEIVFTSKAEGTTGKGLLAFRYRSSFDLINPVALGAESFSADFRYKNTPKKTIVEYDTVDIGGKTYYKNGDYIIDGSEFIIMHITQNEMVLAKKDTEPPVYKIVTWGSSRQ